MLQAWLAKPFQNLSQGSLWPSQREMVVSRRCLICSFFVDLTSSSQMLPDVPFPPISSSTLHHSSFWSNLWSCYSLDQNLAGSCRGLLVPSRVRRWPGRLSSLCLLSMGCGPGSCVFLPRCPEWVLGALPSVHVMLDCPSVGILATPPRCRPPSLPPNLPSPLPAVTLPFLAIKHFQVLPVHSFESNHSFFHVSAGLKFLIVAVFY